jgi:putative redox protein
MTEAVAKQSGASAAGEPDIVAVRVGATGFAQEIQVGQHWLRADEPLAAGGTDTGPSPYDFLVAALGS